MFKILFNELEMYIVVAYFCKPIVLFLWIKARGWKNMSLYCLRIYMWRFIYDALFIFTTAVIILESVVSHADTYKKDTEVSEQSYNECFAKHNKWCMANKGVSSAT